MLSHARKTIRLTSMMIAALVTAPCAQDAKEPQHAPHPVNLAKPNRERERRATGGYVKDGKEVTIWEYISPFSPADQEWIEISVSPDNHFALMSEQKPGDGRKFFFFDQVIGARVGEPRTSYRGTAHEDWNTSGTRIAIVVVQHTEIQRLDLYGLALDGNFAEIPIDKPDAKKLHTERTGKHLPQQGGGHSTGGILKWVDNDTIDLIEIEDRQDSDNIDNYTAVVAKYRVEIDGFTTKVSNLELLGPMDNLAAYNLIPGDHEGPP